LLEAYNDLLTHVQEMKKGELKPEEAMKQKKSREVVAVADTFSSDGVAKAIGNLKWEIGKSLTHLSDGLEEQVNKYRTIKEAVAAKEEELKEIYGIEREVHTLAALLEAQVRKREEFEDEIFQEKERLDKEMKMARAEWEREKKSYEASVKERDTEETKRRQREKDDFTYTFKRNQQLEMDKLDDERGKQEKTLQLKKEESR